MKQHQYVIKASVIIISILLFSTFSNAYLHDTTSLSTTFLSNNNENAHIPTWMVNDTWTYEADIYSDTENGLFDVISDDLTLLVTEIITIDHQNKSEFVYNVSITGTLEGSFDTPDFSGDVSGDINGYALIRQADLSLIHTDINSDGIIQWTIFTFDYELDSIASYYPGFEYFDFPIYVNESWNTSSTVHQNSSMYVENFYDNQTETTSSMSGNASCDSLTDITVPAGTFSSYHIISEGNGTIESYYNESVKSMVHLFVNQSNETDTTTIHLNLISYSLNDQDLQVSAILNPSIVNVDESVELTGQVLGEENNPVSNTPVIIQIPYTEQNYSITTNDLGEYSLTFTAPLILDPTETSYDIGSDGILISATNNSTKGYTVTTLTVIGIAIDDVKAIPPVQYETNQVNLTCYIYSVEPILDKTVSISGPTGFTPLNITLQSAGDHQYFYEQPYPIIGSYSFHMWTQDSIGNTNQSSTHHFTIIEDTIPPMIQNVSITPNPQYANNSVNISCIITDNVAVDQAKVIITDPLAITTNLSLYQNQHNYWYESIYTIIGEYTIRIWTIDTLGNMNQSSSQTLSIISDNTSPSIIDNTPTVGYFNQNFTFNATITDNANVETVTVEYWYDTGSHVNESMNQMVNNQWMKTITIPGSVQTLYYIISAMDTSSNWNNTGIKNITLFEYEIVDINQSMFDRGFPIRHAVDGDWAGAQNFTPNIDILSKVNLYLRKFGSPEFDLTIELRENNPEGIVLDTVSFTPSEVPSSWEWFSVDFTDTIFSYNTDYFIVIPPAPSGIESSFGYEWGYAFGNQYDDGSFWFTRDGGNLWRDLPTMYEFTFQILGRFA